MSKDRPRTPEEMVRELQDKPHLSAKWESARRFHRGEQPQLYDKAASPWFLRVAWEQVRRNKGAAGPDGVTIQTIESFGVDAFLEGLSRTLRERRHKAGPVRRVHIPKANGKMRPLGIPNARDRVAQASALLVLEPIFEADPPETAFGFRAGRNAHPASAGDGPAEAAPAAGAHGGGGCRSLVVLRHDTALQPAAAGCAAGRGSRDSEPHQAMAQSAGDRAGRPSGVVREEERQGNATGGSDIAAVGEHLPRVHSASVESARACPAPRRRDRLLRRRFRDPSLAGTGRSGPRGPALHLRATLPPNVRFDEGALETETWKGLRHRHKGESRR